jgi:hypothetical protein
MQILSNRVCAALQHLALPATIRFAAPGGVSCRLTKDTSGRVVRVRPPNITSSVIPPSFRFLKQIPQKLKTHSF